MTDRAGDVGGDNVAPEPSGNRHLLGSTAVMASGTLVSRLFGAVRLVLTAAILIGSSRQADIFTFALMVPNSLYTIVATGVVNAILVPQLVRANQRDADGGQAYTNRILTAFGLIVAATTVIGVVAAGPLTDLITTASWDAPELAAQYHSMVVLTACCMPQIVFYGLFVLLGQVLNSRGVFGPMMWAPIANNIIQIATLGVYVAVWGINTEARAAAAFTTPQIALLAGGWGLAMVAQCLVLVPFARQVGFRYRPRFDLLHTGLGHTFSLAKWSLAFVAVANLAVLAASRLLMDATTGQTGRGAGKSVWDNAYLVFAMPHSLIAASIATALVPALSGLAAQSRRQDFARQLGLGVELTLTALLPLSLLLLAVGRPLMETVFGVAKGGDLMGWTLIALVVGLVPMSWQYLLTRAYFALEDTRTVFYFELVIAVVWVGLSWILVRAGQVGPDWIAPAVALANSLAYGVGLTVTLAHIRRRVASIRLGPVLRQLGRTLLAAIPGTAAAWAIVWLQRRWIDNLAANLLGLVAAGLTAVGVYLGMAGPLRLTAVNDVLALVTRNRRRDAKEDGMAVVNPPRPDGTPPEPKAPPRPDAGPFPPVGGAISAPILPPAPAPILPPASAPPVQPSQPSAPTEAAGPASAPPVQPSQPSAPLEAAGPASAPPRWGRADTASARPELGLAASPAGPSPLRPPVGRPPGRPPINPSAGSALPGQARPPTIVPLRSDPSDPPASSSVPTAAGSAPAASGSVASAPVVPGPAASGPPAVGPAQSRPPTIVPPRLDPAPAVTGSTPAPAGSASAPDPAGGDHPPGGPPPARPSGPPSSGSPSSSPPSSGPVPVSSADGGGPAPSAPSSSTPRPASGRTPARRGAVAGLADGGDQPVLSGLAPLVEGHLLVDRYRLMRRCGGEALATRWQALDKTLGRPVLVYAVEDDETADVVLQAARRSAVATDARFVRVLDAVKDAEGVYVIAEWVDGTPLSEVLRAGPLTAVESAWVVKEVAEALTTIHFLKVFHQRLDPTRVLITTTGDIRVAGLNTAAVLNPAPADGQRSRDQLEQQDLRDLGRLLYACQTATWPGSEAVGLDEAPRDAAGDYRPAQAVQPAVNATLARVIGQLLAEGQPKLTTATAVLNTLSHILGPADASTDLAHRLALAANSPSLRPAAPAPGARPAAPAGAQTAAGTPPGQSPLAATAPPGAAKADRPDPEQSDTASVEAAQAPPAARPVPQPADRTAQLRTRSRGFVVLAALVVLGLLTALIVSLSRSSDPAADDPTDQPSPPALQPVAIQQAWSFDPFGSGQENDDQLGLAHDGDPATAWWTEDYAVPGFVDINQQPKAGVGLVVDLGREVALRRLQVLLANDPSPLTVYVPTDAADLAAGPPLSGLDGWRAVAEIDPATPDAPAAEGDPAPDPRQRTVELEVTTRYILWLFHGDLPANAAGQYQVGLAEVRLWS